MTIDRVVVVGSSVAGIRAVQALRAGGFADDLVVVGAEPAAPYDKPPLSKQLLTGEITSADIGLLRACTLPGSDEKLVRPPRELNDAAALRARLADGAPVVVIGGGFIGAEVAAAAAAAGCPVTVRDRRRGPLA